MAILACFFKEEIILDFSAPNFPASDLLNGIFDIVPLFITLFILYQKLSRANWCWTQDSNLRGISPPAYKAGAFNHLANPALLYLLIFNQATRAQFFTLAAAPSGPTFFHRLFIVCLFLLLLFLIIL